MKGDGELPEGWRWAKVTEVGQLLRGVSYKKDEAIEAPRTGYVPILRATNIQGDKLVLDDDLVFVPERRVKPNQLLKPGDVVVCMSSGSKHLVGKTAQLSSPWSGSFGTFCAAIRFDESVDSRYAGLYFLSPSYREFIRRKSSGININNLRHSEFEDLQIPIAPVEEQRRIVAKLEELLSRLDAGVASLRRVQAALKRYRASVLKAACEGRLVPQDPNDEPASALLARILAKRRAKWEADLVAKGKDPAKAKYAEPKGPEGEGLGELPEGWCWATVDQLTVNFDGKRVPVKAADRQSRQGPYPYYGASGIIDTIDDYLFHGNYLLIAEDGANLLSRSTPIAFQAYGKFWVNNHAHVVQALGDCPLGYLEIFLNSLDLKFNVTGSAQPKLTQANLNRIGVPLPPLREQVRIVALTDERLSVVAQMEQSMPVNITRAERLRQAVLRRAFEGKLVAQNPSDVSAGAPRIRQPSGAQS